MPLTYNGYFLLFSHRSCAKEFLFIQPQKTYKETLHTLPGHLPEVRILRIQQTRECFYGVLKHAACFLGVYISMARHIEDLHQGIAEVNLYLRSTINLSLVQFKKSVMSSNYILGVHQKVCNSNQPIFFTTPTQTVLACKTRKMYRKLRDRCHIKF